MSLLGRENQKNADIRLLFPYLMSGTIKYYYIVFSARPRVCCRTN